MTRALAAAPRLRRQPGKGHRKHGAPPGTALDRDGAAMRFGDPLGDGEPESGAGTLFHPGARRVRPPEAVEYMLEVTRRNADSGIPDRQGDRVALIGEAQRDLAA